MIKALATSVLLGILFSSFAANGAAPQVAGRSNHALALKSDGTVVAWGSDANGQLATGRALFSSTPTAVPNLPDIQAVASYSNHVLALDVHGRVWAWGSNAFGQLGVRVQRNSALPGRVQGIDNVIAVAATDTGSVALKSDGTVWVWGGSPYGELGFAATPTPFKIQGLSNVVQISAGLHHVAARKTDGTVMAFGLNLAGELGNGTFVSSMTPTAVPGLANVVDIAAGTNSTRAVTADGKLWGWGVVSGNYLLPRIPNPHEFTGLPSPAVKLMGGLNGFAVLANGAVWRFGDDQVPQQINGFAGIVKGEVARIFDETIMGITADGRLFASTLNHYGQAGAGNTTLLFQAVTQVPLANVAQVAAGHEVLFAVTADKKLWVWGKDAEGTLGKGATILYTSPQPVAGVTNIVKVSASLSANMALDANGDVWVWGSNDNGGIGSGSRTPSAVPVKVPISGVKDIAAGWEHHVFLKTDGTVWMAGIIPGFFSAMPIQLPTSSLPPILSIAAGWQTIYFITATGQLYAMGENSSGQVGNGSLAHQSTPVAITTITEPVVQVAADFRFALAVTSTGRVWAWGNNAEYVLGAQAPSQTSLPQVVPGLANIVEVAAGRSHFLARRSDGIVMSWGNSFPGAYGRDGPGVTAAPVAELDSVTSIATSTQASFAVRADGTVWGWGQNSISNGILGDGTLTARFRPVVVIAERGTGNLETNNWFLDARPGVAKSIPAAKVPRAVTMTQALGSTGLLNVDASVSVRTSDQSKNLGLYVVGLVPPEFLAQVKTVSGTQAKVAQLLKAGVPILVNLTGNGWTIAAGQLQAFTTGTSSAFLGAGNILTNLNPALIPGARFCIGYGESASSMLSTGTMVDFLSLEGASTNTLGLPCLLSGVYVDGPRTSAQGSTVPLRAVVVGQAPSGTVRFRDGLTDISSSMALAAVNQAVSQATLNFQASAVGERAFGASYSGDSLNVAAVSEVPLRSSVRVAQAATTTRLSGPVSSEIGMEARFVAYITGSAPTGTVQFKRGGANEGLPVPVVNDQAVRSVVGLALGDHSITAEYSGSGAHSPSVSQALVHRVLDVSTSTATLTSSANPVAGGSAATLTVVVTGTSPGGQVTLREDGATVAVGTLANGTVSFTVPNLTPGVHVFYADYAGDSTNPKATSNALFQQVSLAAAPAVNPARLVNIATRMQVLTGNDVMIAGFIIGGTTPKTVVVNVAGPTLASAGITNPLANPSLTLVRSSDNAIIAANDNWQSAANASAIQSSGFAPANSLEPAIMMTLAPGAYTAIVQGVGGTGVGLVGVFEVDHPEVPLINISTRGQVLTGNDVMIAGFIIQGTSSQTVVVNVAGPSLVNYGITNPLANPTLTLVRSSDNAIIATNDNWQNAANASAIQASGFAPANALEPAIMMTLPPGAYTAIVQGVSNGTGVALVGVFTAP